MASKLKAQNPKQHFKDSNIFFLSFKVQIIRLGQ